MIELNPVIDIDASVRARTRQSHEGMVKCWEDAARYEFLIERLKPSLVVEIGTFSGKSALWFSQFAPVLTIDVDPIEKVEPETPPRWDAAPHPIRQHVGTSVEPLTHAQVLRSMAKHPGPVLLCLDGNHSAHIVENELNIYGELAGYIVVEDTLLRWFPPEEQVYDGNPMDALEAWLPQHPEWEIDREIEGLHPVTQFPNGWLKRSEND